MKFIILFCASVRPALEDSDADFMAAMSSFESFSGPSALPSSVMVNVKVLGGLFTSRSRVTNPGLPPVTIVESRAFVSSSRAFIATVYSSSDIPMDLAACSILAISSGLSSLGAFLPAPLNMNREVVVDKGFCWGGVATWNAATGDNSRAHPVKRENFIVVDAVARNYCCDVSTKMATNTKRQGSSTRYPLQIDYHRCHIHKTQQPEKHTDHTTSRWRSNLVKTVRPAFQQAAPLEFRHYTDIIETTSRHIITFIFLPFAKHKPYNRRCVPWCAKQNQLLIIRQRDTFALCRQATPFCDRNSTFSKEHTWICEWGIRRDPFFTWKV
jgi:hypothetical protein